MLEVTRGNDTRCEQQDEGPGRLLIKIIAGLYVRGSILAEQRFCGKQSAEKKAVGSQ